MDFFGVEINQMKENSKYLAISHNKQSKYIHPFKAQKITGGSVTHIVVTCWKGVNGNFPQLCLCDIYFRQHTIS